MMGLFSVAVSPLVPEGEAVIDGIVQVVVANADVERVGVVVHVDEVHEVGCLCRGDVLKMKFVGIASL